MPVEFQDRLNFDDILTLAERETGAYGFASEGLIARASALVEKINSRGPYAPHQIEPMRQQVQRMLAERLKLLLDRERFPGIVEEKIERPIFIVGFPRSGTTLLHSLLAEDPQMLAVQSWHLFSPSPPPGAGPVCAERIDFAKRRIQDWMDFSPGQRAMHPYIDKGAYQLCENEELFSLDFHNAYPYFYFRVPTIEPTDVGMTDEGIKEGYVFLRELMQHLQWNTGKTRWVCKGPSAQLHIGALLEAFPDALCVWPHRPLVDIYASNVALRASIYDAIQGSPKDWTSQPKVYVEKMKAAFDELMTSDMIKDPRIMHMSFHDIAEDPIAALRKIYERHSLPIDSEFEQRAGSWLADPENAVDRYGRYPYNYEAFGLDRAWVEELFSDYSRYFGLE